MTDLYAYGVHFCGGRKFHGEMLHT